MLEGRILDYEERIIYGECTPSLLRMMISLASMLCAPAAALQLPSTAMVQSVPMIVENFFSMLVSLSSLV